MSSAAVPVLKPVWNLIFESQTSKLNFVSLQRQSFAIIFQFSSNFYHPLKQSGSKFSKEIISFWSWCGWWIKIKFLFVFQKSSFPSSLEIFARFKLRDFVAGSLQCCWLRATTEQITRLNDKAWLGTCLKWGMGEVHFGYKGKNLCDFVPNGKTQIDHFNETHVQCFKADPILMGYHPCKRISQDFLNW